MTQPDIRLFCSDIDGTLLNADRWLSEETVSAFAKANLPLILASSRPPVAMRYLQDGLNITGAPLIAYNGGLILGMDSEILQSNTFSTAILELVVAHHKNHTYNLSIYSHDHWFTEKEDVWSLREINNTRAMPTYQPNTISLNFLKDKVLGIHKLMCMGTPEEMDSIVATLSGAVRSDVHLYRSKDTYLEITPRHIDKAKALEVILETYYDFGMDSVMAFGDNHNDDELIRLSGLGVAVQNATKTLKSLADHVSPFTNKEDGVARAVEHLLDV